MFRASLLVLMIPLSGCMSTLTDFAPLELQFTSDFHNNPRFPIITLVGRGDCRPLAATLSGRRAEGARCQDASWQVATSGDFELTDGSTVAKFAIRQVEPLIGGTKFMTYPLSPQYLQGLFGQRVQLDMGVPVECLPTDFETQLANQQVERSADGTLSFVATRGLQLEFRALCVTGCEGATCAVLGERDQLVVQVMTP